MIPQPVIQPVPDAGGIASVVQRHEVRLPVSGKLLEVLPGFLFDGTSIPREAWTFTGVTPFDPDMLAASVAHDALVRAELLAPHECDAEFEALLKANSKRGREFSALFYTIVRIAASTVWKQHTPESIAQNRRFCSLM